MKDLESRETTRIKPYEKPTSVARVASAGCSLALFTELRWEL